MPELTSLEELTATPHAQVFADPEPRTVRLKLDADERVPPHTHPATNVVIHLVDGRLEVRLDDETYDMEAGDLLRFSGEREVAPHAIEPSTAVIVIAPVDSAGE